MELDILCSSIKKKTKKVLKKVKESKKKVKESESVTPSPDIKN
jgi:hypothetical protein